ncbi:MAG: hypothetical protein WBB19_02855 [Desulforhopalus sp.]
MNWYNLQKLLVSILIIFLYPAIVFAAGPSLNNVSIVNDKIVISGQQLGSHPDHSPNYPGFLNVAWNDFDDGVMAKNGMGMLSSAYAGNWSVESDNNRPNSKHYVQKAYRVGSRGGALGLKQSAKYNVLYYSFWFKMRKNTQSGKFTRIWGVDNENVYLSTGGNNTSIRGNFEYGVGGATQWSSPDSFGYENWRRVEIRLDIPNHSYTVWLDGIHQWTRTNWVPTDFNGIGGIWEVGGMIDDPAASGGKDGGYNYDDLYFSGTQARVEIGNAATWDACTRREIQIPTAWGTSSVTAKANFGAFNYGNTAYLYVVDSKGNISNNGKGVKIVINKQSESTADPTPAPTPDPIPTILSITKK